MEFIRLVESNGGLLNGSTRFDFTNYFQVVPSHVLETMLWAEADRMRGLQITQENLKNQQEVVKNEVKVNVLNQPYGGFPWIDLPMAANTNWYNAHNFYGDLAHLDAATLDDVKTFFKTFYAPNNAVLVVSGDFDPAAAQELDREVFRVDPLVEAAAAARSRRAAAADRAQGGAHRSAREPPRPRPRLPRPGSWHAGVVRLRPDRSGAGAREPTPGSTTSSCASGRSPAVSTPASTGGSATCSTTAARCCGLPRCSTTRGPRPTLLRSAVDEVIGRLQQQALDQATLDRARVKMRSALYASTEQFAGFGRANLLASFALFDDDPGLINRLESEFDKVTPALVQKTAREYLRPTNRTVYVITPGKKDAAPAAAQQ